MGNYNVNWGYVVLLRFDIQCVCNEVWDPITFSIFFKLKHRTRRLDGLKPLNTVLRRCYVCSASTCRIKKSRSRLSTGLSFHPVEYTI
jgi:hypothetical protein